MNAKDETPASPKRHGLIILAFITAIVVAIPGPARAVDFVGWINTLHQEFWDLVKDQPKPQKTYWDLLEGKDQDAILEQLNKDLGAGYLKLAESSKSAETAKKLSEWRKKIADLQGIEDEVRRIRPGAEKSLGQLIDETTPQEGLGAKYRDKYLKMLATAVQQNPKMVAEAAGEIAGGEYQKAAEKIVPTFVASGMGSIVSDVLEELNYTDTKVVWDKLVENASTLKTAGQALAKGDYDAAWAALIAQYKVEAKGYSKKLVASAINSVLSPSGLTSSNALIDGAANTVSVGDLYVALLEAEIAFIEWSDNYIQQHSDFGDGACVRLYVETYERTESAGFAYEQFADCQPLARKSAFFAFSNGVKDLGVNEVAATKLFLEDHRRRMPNSDHIMQWLQHKIAVKQKASQRALSQQLRQANEKANRQHKLILAVIGEWMLDTALFKLEEAKLILLEKELDELIAQVEELIESLEDDIERVAKNYDGIAGICPTYEAAKVDAVAALQLGEAAQAKAQALNSALQGFDRDQCIAWEEGDATADDHETWLNDVKASRASLAALSSQVTADVGAICAAPGAIRGASDKQTGRDLLDEALELANTVKDDTQFELTDLQDALEDTVDKSREGDPTDGQDVSAVTEALSQLRAELRDATVTRDRSQIDLSEALPLMYREVQRSRTLMDVTTPKLKAIEDKLKPLERAPVANNVRVLLANLRALRDDAIYCDEALKVSWYEEGDADSRGASGITLPWSRAQIYINPPIPVLANDLDEIAGLCSALGDEGAGPQDFLAAIESEATGARVEIATIQNALDRIDGCVAQAVVAYDDQWLQPQLVAVPDVTGSTVDDARPVLQGQNLGLSVGDDAGNDDIGQATIASQSPAPGEQVDERTDIIVALLPPEPKEEEAPEQSSADALAQGQAQLAQCDIDGFRQTYASLPDDAPEKATLRAAYGNEQQAREIAKQGKTLFDQEKFGEAAALLDHGAGLAQCQNTRDRLQAAATTARDRSAPTETADADPEAEQDQPEDGPDGAAAVAAAQACDFDTAVALAQQLPKGHADRERVKDLLDAERDIRARIDQGRSMAEAGDREGALLVLDSARSWATCPATVAVIDQLTAGLQPPTVVENQPQPSPSPEPRPAVTQPEPEPEPEPYVDTATIESLIDNCQLAQAEALIAQIPFSDDRGYHYNSVVNEQYRLIDDYNYALEVAQSGGDLYFARDMLSGPAFSARCWEIRSRAESLMAQIDDAIYQQELAAEQQRAEDRRRAQQALVTGLSSVLEQLQGRGRSVPAAGGGSIGGGLGSAGSAGASAAGNAGPDCASFQREAQAHSQRAGQLTMQYQSMAGAGKDAIRAKACEMMREFQKGEDIIRRAQAQGCASPQIDLTHYQMMRSGMGEVC